MFNVCAYLILFLFKVQQFKVRRFSPRCSGLLPVLWVSLFFVQGSRFNSSRFDGFLLDVPAYSPSSRHLPPNWCATPKWSSTRATTVSTTASTVCGRE